MAVAGSVDFVLGADASQLNSVRNSLAQFARQTDSLIRTVQGLGPASQSAFAAQEAAIRKARQQALDMDTTLKVLGNSPAAKTLGANMTRSLTALERAMKSGKLSATEYQRAIDRWNSSFGNVNRQVINMAREQGKLSGIQMGAAGITGQFAQQTQQAAAVQNTYIDRTQKAGTASKTAAHHLGLTTSGMTDLAKAVQIALGPLSGVAARITAFTSLVNRNTIAIAASIAGLIAYGTVVGKATRVTVRFENEMARLENRVRSTGEAAGFNAQEFDQMARNFGMATLSSATEGRKAILTLTTATTLQEKNFERALAAAQDLADTGYGGLSTNAQRLARVLQDPIANTDALTRIGVRFTESQKDQFRALINTGRAFEAHSIILSEIEDRVGGNSRNVSQLASAYDTLQETVTNFFTDALSTTEATQAMADVVNTVTIGFIALTNAMGAAQGFGNSVAGVMRGLSATIEFVVRNVHLLTAALLGLFAGVVFTRTIKGIMALTTLLVKLTRAIIAFNVASAAGTALRLLPVIMAAAAAATAAFLIKGEELNQFFEDLGVQARKGLDAFQEGLGLNLEEFVTAAPQIDELTTAVKEAKFETELLSNSWATFQNELNPVVGQVGLIDEEVLRLAHDAGVLGETIRNIGGSRGTIIEFDMSGELMSEISTTLTGIAGAAQQAGASIEVVRDEVRALNASKQLNLTAEQIERVTEVLATNQVGVAVDIVTTAVTRQARAWQTLNNTLRDNRAAEALFEQADAGLNRFEQLDRELRKIGMSEAFIRQSENVAKFNINVERSQELLDAHRHNLMLQTEEIQNTMALTERSMGRVGDAFIDSLDKSKDAAFDFRNVMFNIVTDIIREMLKLQLINPIINELFGTQRPTLGSSAGILGAFFGGGGAGAGEVEAGTGAVSSAGGLAGIISGIGSFFGGFQHGGSFQVGGTGGSDSQRVSFMASPGETVQIHPTAAGMRNGGGGGGAANITMYVDATGASRVELERLRKLVIDMNATIETRSVQAVVAERRANPKVFGGGR